MSNLPAQPNSDTMAKEPSPYPKKTTAFNGDSNEWTVRSIRRAWNSTQAHEQWELLVQSKTYQEKDKRIVVIDEKSQLFQAIVEADPRVKNLKCDGPVRDLLPTYKVKATKRGIYHYVDAYAVIPLLSSEKRTMDNRVHFDELDDLRVELGLGRAEADHIISEFVAQDNWSELSAAALREKEAQTAALKKPTVTPPAEPEPADAETQQKCEAIRADVVDEIPPEPAQDTAGSSELDGWFPRDENGKPVTPPDAPVYNWTLFWVSVRNLIAGADLIIDDHHEYVHKFFDVPEGGSLKDRNEDPNELLRRFSAHLNEEKNKVTAPETTEITQERWLEWLNAHDWNKKPFVLTALNYDSIERGEGPVTKLSEWDRTLDDAEDAVQLWLAKQQQPATENTAKSGQGDAQTQPSAPTGHDEPTTRQGAAPVSEEAAIEAPKANPDKFDIDPFLTDAKTLMGIPATRIQEFVNRKYARTLDEWPYSTTKAPGGGQWTVIDPLAVRQRFDKVFGPHGIGWRIVPVEGAQTFVTPTKQGQRDMYEVTLSGYVMEYRMRIGETVEWQRTSAFTDSNDSSDLGYASVGAFSSLMKQALKMLGGYDHFILEKEQQAKSAA